MTVFERIIPLAQRVQWLMLKIALEEGVTSDLIAKRLDWSREHVYQVVWGDPRNLRLDCVAEWFFACGGRMPKFSIQTQEG